MFTAIKINKLIKTRVTFNAHIKQNTPFAIPDLQSSELNFHEDPENNADD